MTSFLLDTNILSDLVRNPGGRVAEEISKVGESAIATSIIVAAELRFGAVKSGSKRLYAQVVSAVPGGLHPGASLISVEASDVMVQT